MTAPRSDVLVFFGATGDLAYKEIFPALFQMAREGALPMPVIGVARSPLSRAQFHERARRSLIAHGSYEEGAFHDFARQLHYLAGDYQDTACFAQLETRLKAYSTPLFYLAIPPALFSVVIQGIARSACAGPARLILEKPFGRNAASARALTDTLHTCFPESSLFRLDHFLAMQTVENLMYFRAANTFIQPLWDSRYINDVQILLAEDFGVAERGAFYDDVGALRDVVQNHLFQVFSLLAMEAPEESLYLSADLLWDAQLELFRDVRPLDADDVVLGQFDGYTQVPGVRTDSRVETYAALRLSVDNARWRGVPFYIRTGKRLACTCTEVRIRFKPAAGGLLGANEKAAANYLRFRLYPDMQIALGARVKTAAGGQTAELLAQRWDASASLPYQRLLGDAIKGDHGLFTRPANVEAAWHILDAVLDRSDIPLHAYAPGSWGPVAADRLLRGGDAWHKPA